MESLFVCKAVPDGAGGFNIYEVMPISSVPAGVALGDVQFIGKFGIDNSDDFYDDEGDADINISKWGTSADGSTVFLTSQPIKTTDLEGTYIDDLNA